MKRSDNMLEDDFSRYEAELVDLFNRTTSREIEALIREAYANMLKKDLRYGEVAGDHEAHKAENVKAAIQKIKDEMNRMSGWSYFLITVVLLVIVLWILIRLQYVHQKRFLRKYLPQAKERLWLGIEEIEKNNEILNSRR